MPIHNQFIRSNYPIGEPLSFVAGDFVRWQLPELGSEYPSSDYAVSYSSLLQGRNANQAVTFDFSAVFADNIWYVEIPATTSTNVVLGRYNWQSYVTRSTDSERITVAEGEWVVKADVDTDLDDPIDHLRERYKQLEDAIEVLATRQMSSYSIAGRSMTYANLPELIDMRNATLAELNMRVNKRFRVVG